jgi:thymidylate synthase (FAD)
MYKVLDHGYVRYLDHMGDDGTIAMDARTSYDKRTPGEDRALLRRLMRDRHTSPFEMGVVKVEMKMPIFVARQIVRHRTASMNEVSGRYTKLPDEMYEPNSIEVQSKDNKQGRGDVIERYVGYIKNLIRSSNRESYNAYETMIERDVSREIARGVLPLNTYTKFVWKMDLHNLLHFLQLRLDPHAQYECRVYAEALWEIVKELFPITAEAFEDYRLEGVSLSRFEKDMLVSLVNGEVRLKTLHDIYVGPGTITEGEWKKFVTTFKL